MKIFLSKLVNIFRWVDGTKETVNILIEDHNININSLHITLGSFYRVNIFYFKLMEILSIFWIYLKGKKLFKYFNFAFHVGRCDDRAFRRSFCSSRSVSLPAGRSYLAVYRLDKNGLVFKA